VEVTGAVHSIKKKHHEVEKSERDSRSSLGLSHQPSQSSVERKPLKTNHCRCVSHEPSFFLVWTTRQCFVCAVVAFAVSCFILSTFYLYIIFSLVWCYCCSSSLCAIPLFKREMGFQLATTQPKVVATRK